MRGVLFGGAGSEGACDRLRVRVRAIADGRFSGSTNRTIFCLGGIARLCVGLGVIAMLFSVDQLAWGC